MARDVVLGAVDGYNGTIFAYGQVSFACLIPPSQKSQGVGLLQTGSRKTFTVQGGDNYNDRGVIPRALEVFRALERVPNRFEPTAISCLYPRPRKYFLKWADDRLDVEKTNNTRFDLSRAHRENSLKACA